MQITRKFILGAAFAVCAFTTNLAQANIVIAHGTGTAPFGGRDSNGNAVMSASDEQDAIAKAELNAIDMYFAKQSDSATDNYESIRKSIASNLQRYVLQYDILNEQRTGSGITVILKTTLNGSLLDLALKKASATAETASGQRSLILSVFVARQIASIKQFDAHVYKRVDADVKVNGHLDDSNRVSTKTGHNGSQGESISGNHIAVKDSKSTQKNTRQKADFGKNVNATSISETGGSITQKSSQSTWRLYPSANLNSSITSVLARQGYQVVDEADAESNSSGVISIRKIDDAYATGQDLPPKMLNSIENAAKVMGIRYVILGTMDMGQVGKDPESLDPRVDVTVNAKVYDLSGRFVRQRVVVGPVQYAGLGNDETTAQIQALKNAGVAVAKEVVSQMQEIGLH